MSWRSCFAYLWRRQESPGDGLANVPSFWFRSRRTWECTLIPVFVPRGGPKGVSTKGVSMKRPNLPYFRAFYTVVSKGNFQKSPWSWISLLWRPFWSFPSSREEHANVASFQFLVPGNIRQNHPFGNHPCANPRKKEKNSNTPCSSSHLHSGQGIPDLDGPIRANRCAGDSRESFQVGKIEWGGVQKACSCDSRLVLKPDVAIASEVSISKKESFAIADSLAKKTQLNQGSRTEPPFLFASRVRFARIGWTLWI